MTFQPARPNALPVDPDTGGLAAMVGWVDATSGAALPCTTGVVTLAPDQAAETSWITAGVTSTRIPATPGQQYTAGITSDGFVALSLLWVFGDGVVSDPTSNAGEGRVAVTAIAPANTVGVALEVIAATARAVDNGDGTYTVTYWTQTDTGGAFWTDQDASLAGRHISNPVLVVGGIDPGPMPPLQEDTSYGGAWYASLPQFMRTDDATRDLYEYLHATGSAMDTASSVAGRIRVGELTDPNVMPDGWVPWLAQIAGIPPGTVAGQRGALQARQIAPRTGTVDALVALARQFLSGSKVADIFPHPTTGWTLVVRVRADEIAVGDETALRAAMVATGLIPAGWALQVISGLATWAAWEAANPTWDAYDGRLWAVDDSLGVVGL